MPKHVLENFRIINITSIDIRLIIYGYFMVLGFDEKDIT